MVVVTTQKKIKLSGGIFIMNKKLVFSLLGMISLSSIQAESGFFERALSAPVRYSHAYHRVVMNSQEKMAEVVGRFVDNHWGKCLLGYLGVCVSGAVAAKILRDRQQEKNHRFYSGYGYGRCDGERRAIWDDAKTREIQTQTDFE